MTSIQAGESSDGKNDLTCCQRVCFSLGMDCCHGGTSIMDKIDEVRENADRTCTDVPFCILLLSIFIAQAVIFDYVKVTEGADPSWLFRGRDYLGQECSKDQVFVWPEPTNYKVGVCADSCDASNTALAMVGSSGGLMSDTVCGYSTSKWYGHWCLPDPDSVVNLSGFGDADNSLNTAFGDVVTVQNWLIGSAFIALVFGFIYTKFLQYCTKCVVWCSIALVVIGGFFTGYVIMQQAQVAADNDWGERTSQAMWITGAVVVVLDLLFIIALCFMTKSINLACDVVEQAASAFQQIWTVVFFPILTFISLLGYFAFWFIIAIYIASVEVETTNPLSEAEGCGVVGQKYNLGQRLYHHTNGVYPDGADGRDAPTDYIYYEFNSEFMNYMWFHIFCGFWTVQFIVYWSYAVIAGVFAEWYFSPFASDSGEKKTMKSGSVILRSMWRISRYHTGTVAFGALIIAIIRFIRAIFMYIQAKMIDRENPVAQCCLCVIHCLLKCLDCCIDKLSKDGFVFTSIFGTPFCSSAIMAFDMIMKNLVNVAALAVVSDYIEIIGKISISCFSTGAVIFAIDMYYENNEISSYMVIGLALLAITYLVAIVFMHLFDVAIETLFLCYVIDLEATGGKPKYASQAFQDMVAKHKDESAEQAAKIKTLQQGETVTARQMTQMAGEPTSRGGTVL